MTQLWYCLTLESAGSLCLRSTVKLTKEKGRVSYMEHGTLIELTNDCVDFWSTPTETTGVDDHVGLLREGDWIIFLGVASMDTDTINGVNVMCDLLHVVSRFGVGYINANEVPEYTSGDKIES